MCYLLKTSTLLRPTFLSLCLRNLQETLVCTFAYVNGSMHARARVCVARLARVCVYKRALAGGG
jgi:hypothetical protein